MAAAVSSLTVDMSSLSIVRAHTVGVLSQHADHGVGGVLVTDPEENPQDCHNAGATNRS